MKYSMTEKTKVTS